ncbi:MAG: hypothetical protein IH987_00305 [Planctomycetes bacterium]|nr:hypothetical protein [Planctomycetota bacterium]
MSPNVEVGHVADKWMVIFAPDAPPDLVNHIELGSGVLSYYRRVVIDSTLSQPPEFTTRHELAGYVLAYGIRPRGVGTQPRPLTSILVIHAPILPILVILTAYPTFAFIRGPLRRYRRRKRGLCLRCGYNLEGNVSGVCPECGEEAG